MTKERQYNVKTFTPDDIIRLKQIINDGINVKQEIEDLNEGLNDTIKAIAEEMEIKPSQLKKAIGIAFKSTLDEERDKMTEIEDILAAVGRA